MAIERHDRIRQSGEHGLDQRIADAQCRQVGARQGGARGFAAGGSYQDRNREDGKRG